MNEFRIVVTPFEVVQDINGVRTPKLFKKDERLVLLHRTDDTALFRLRSYGKMNYLAVAAVFDKNTRRDPE
jgi:hypothetical protein